MEKVVYLIGAGFSAPLGLPVMSNFRIKSEEMFAAHPERYPHFKEVFNTIRHLSVAKNYYETDLFNIEEILSILEMGEYLEGKSLKKNFIQYIIDVIEYYTPPVALYEQEKMPGNWSDWLFGPDRTWHPYGFFIANLLNLHFIQDQTTFPKKPYSPLTCIPLDTPQTQYSVITLNYDLVPENVCSYVNDAYQIATPFSFTDIMAQEPSRPALAKLHGSVHSGVIVPPTWSKGVNKKITPAWKLAYQLLAEATHLRVIGYSLPTADAYVKYLLKAAVTEDPHLKKIDVICRDGDGSVKQRYEEFFKFKYFDFVSADIVDYLTEHAKMYERYADVRNQGVKMNKLEEAHIKYVSSRR